VDGERSMTKSELIELIAAKQSHLPAKDVELAVKQILEIMSDALAQGQRIEIRGFGSFSLHFRPPRQGRNPKTGETVALAGKYVPHFKPGKDLRERVNDPDGLDAPTTDDDDDDDGNAPPLRPLPSASPSTVD
jgi:integration host factor subunit beta